MCHIIQYVQPYAHLDYAQLPRKAYPGTFLEGTTLPKHKTEVRFLIC